MKKTLFRSLFTVSAFTFLSRVMGLVRDILFALYFGASASMDAFSVAFRIPNLFRRFFGEGAFNQAFVPVFSEYKTKSSKDELKLFLAQISGSLGIILLITSILGVLFSSSLVMLFASGFKNDIDKFMLTNDLVKLMIPYIFFICMTAMYSSTLNALDKFSIPALTPVILNLVFIIAALVSSYFSKPIMTLGYAVFIAGILQLVAVFYVVYREGLITKPRIDFKAEGVKKVMLLMLPALIGSSSSQINILINTQLASRLVEGSVTWLYYSDRLVEFVLGTFAVALGTVVLPRLSRLNVQEEKKNLFYTIDWSLTLSFIIGIPATIALYLLAEPLVALLFMRGAFTYFDVEMAARSLCTYSLSIPAFFMIRVLAPVYFAKQDTKTPLKYSLIAIATNVCLQFVLVRYYQHAGLALSSSIAAWVNAGLLAMGLYRDGSYNFLHFFTKEKLALVPGNLILIILLLWVTSFSVFWIDGEILLRLGAMSLLVIISAVLYFGIIHIAGLHLSNLKNPKEV